MPEPQKIAIATGASQGIGAGLVAAFRDAGLRPQPSLPSRRGFHPKRSSIPPAILAVGAMFPSNPE